MRMNPVLSTLTLTLIVSANWTAAVAQSMPTAEKWWVIIPKDSGGDTWMGDSQSIVKPVEAYFVYKGDRQPRDPGLRIVWFHQFHLVAAGDGTKSAKRQWVVDCEKRTWRPVRYIGYDMTYKVLDSRDIADANPIPVELGYPSEYLFEFTCNSVDYRKKHYTEVPAGNDYRAFAESLNNTRPPTAATPETATPAFRATPTRSPPGNVDPGDRAAGLKYQQCVSASARKFAKSKEEAPVVAQSALQNCAAMRRGLYARIKKNRSYYEAKALIEKIDEHVLADAQLTVVKARSQK